MTAPLHRFTVPAGTIPGTRENDAAILRMAAAIILKRSRKQTFGIRVIRHFLEHTADHIEGKP